MDIKRCFVFTEIPILSEIFSKNKETTTKSASIMAKVAFSICFCVQNRKFDE